MADCKFGNIGDIVSVKDISVNEIIFNADIASLVTVISPVTCMIKYISMPDSIHV